MPDLIEWPPYAPDTDEYLDLGAALEVKMGVAAADMAPDVGEE